jgi:hypothetical protein
MSLLFVAAAAVPSGAEKTLLDYIAQSREVGLLIILLSLFVTAVIIAQLFTIRLARLAPDDHIERPRPAPRLARHPRRDRVLRGRRQPQPAHPRPGRGSHPLRPLPVRLPRAQERGRGAGRAGGRAPPADDRHRGARRVHRADAGPAGHRRRHGRRVRHDQRHRGPRASRLARGQHLRGAHHHRHGADRRDPLHRDLHLPAQPHRRPDHRYRRHHRAAHRPHRAPPVGRPAPRRGARPQGRPARAPGGAEAPAGGAPEPAGRGG